jgi:hypothetical protein
VQICTFLQECLFLQGIPNSLCLGRTNYLFLRVCMFFAWSEVDRKLEAHANGGCSHDTTHAGPSHQARLVIKPPDLMVKSWQVRGGKKLKSTCKWWWLQS